MTSAFYAKVQLELDRVKVGKISEAEFAVADWLDDDFWNSGGTDYRVILRYDIPVL